MKSNLVSTPCKDDEKCLEQSSGQKKTAAKAYVSAVGAGVSIGTVTTRIFGFTVPLGVRTYARAV